MLQSALILFTVVVSLAMLSWPRLSSAPFWRATVTPLASIIGSGFLVLGPILDSAYGLYAPFAMLLLCVVAYGFGSAIRFNIQHIEQQPNRTPGLHRLEIVASWVLAFAYFISVAYYLNLFGAFGVSLTTVNTELHARMLTSAVFLLILFVGWTRGFLAMERLEQISVSVKLAIIMGLLVGLAMYNWSTLQSRPVTLNAPTVTGWPAITLLFGLIVTVQGFETSRYLSDTYDARTRIRSMKLAQYVATAIYLTYIILLAYVFESGTIELDETAIIDLMAIVAPLLPLLLVTAALSAQFSAAVADTGGAGGLIAELSAGRISIRQAYALLVSIGLILTWTVDLFDIIAYASRAFALYYALQASIAFFSVRATNSSQGKLQALFAALATLGILIAIFGQSVE